jgi:hypothetical protein
MTSSYEVLEFRPGFAGGCYVNGAATCVAEPEDHCDEGTFVTPHYLRSNHGHPLRYCAGDLADVTIGRCMDSGACSNLASRCEDSSTFVALDETCTITQDLSSGEDIISYVTYGRCGDRCVWSPENCLEGEDYTPFDPDCKADKVPIGACFAGHAFCAVGPESCTQAGFADEPYWDHERVQDMVGANCFLSFLPLPLAPTRAPWTRSPTAEEPPSKFDPPPQANTSINDDMASSFGYGIVAVVAVLAILLGILIGVSTVYCKRNDDEWRVEKDKELSLPTEMIETSHQPEYAESCITDI